MITNLKNDRLLFLIKGKKYPYKHRNKYLLCWFSVIILLVLAAVFVYGLMKYTYGKLDICDLSARTIYKNGIEPIEDQNYFEEKNVNTNSNGDIVPELELNNKVLTLNPNDIKGVYLAWVYTGNERFEYNGNYQWKELIETGKKFNYNTGYGYRTAYDTKEVELSENGWYTVFAIWYEGGQKLHIAKNFAVANGREVIYEPKTPKSKRDITLPDFLCAIVQDYAGRLLEYDPDDRLFPFTKSWVNSQLRAGCKKSGVKKIRVHDFRHSHASLLIHMGFPILAVSERLGHEKVQTTLELYGHLYPDVHGNVAQQLQDSAAADLSPAAWQNAQKSL